MFSVRKELLVCISLGNPLVDITKLELDVQKFVGHDPHFLAGRTTRFLFSSADAVL